MSDRLLSVDKARLKLHEGLRLKPYRDTVGKLTIGYGRNLTDRGLTEAEAEFLLDNDIKSHSEELAKALPWLVNLDPARQAVLVDMAFNLGVPGLLKFKNTLRAVREGRFEDAAKGMLASKWARQVKGRAVRLAEAMKTGNANS
jgi:lysozyme